MQTQCEINKYEVTKYEFLVATQSGAEYMLKKCFYASCAYHMTDGRSTFLWLHAALTFNRNATMVHLVDAIMHAYYDDVNKKYNMYVNC